MKRLSIVGLMLASAFALTNCSQEIVPPIQENDVIVDESIKEDTTPEEVVSIPFEVYANPSAETKTSHDSANNGTKWVDKDEINVYHSVHGENSYTNNHKFTILDVNKGLFGGGLAEPLASGTYDWCFLYPYDESRGNTLTAATVKIGTDEQGNFIQTQSQADSKSHIAGTSYPMFGSTKTDYPNGIPAGENPKVRMKHLSALVAVKLVNETGNDITINHIELEAANHPIVGKFNVDLTKSTPIFSVTSDGDKNKENDGYSNSAILKLGAEGIQINKAVGTDESYAKFYMAVAPVTDKFTIRINGAEISNDVEIPLVSGKVTTLKVTIPALLGTQTFNTKKGSTDFVTWDNKSESTATINGQQGLKVYTVSNGTITIKGTLADFLGKDKNNSALPLSFYAASKVTQGPDGKLVESPANLEVKSVSIYKHILIEVPKYIIFGSPVVWMDKEIDMSFAGEDLSANMGGMRVGFDLPKLGLFQEDLNKNNLIILDETDNYYYLDENKANTLIKSAGVDFQIQGFRDAIFDADYDAWVGLYNLARKLAPGQFNDLNGGKGDTALGELLNGLIDDGALGGIIRGVATIMIQSADITIVLQTTGDAVCWGLNVQSKDTDISKAN